MASEMNPLCAKASSQIKLFIDDLLTEEDYAQFSDHVEFCEKCRQMVRTVGSLSNQIWELGELEVPSDFTETVSFQIRHKPVPEKPDAKPVNPAGALKKNLLLLVVLLLTVTTAWFAFRDYQRGRRAVPGKNPAASSGSETGAPNPGPENGVHAAFESFLSSEPLPTPGGAGTTSQETAPVAEAAHPEAPAAQPDPAGEAAPRPLHWHYLYSSETEAQKALELIRLYAPSVPSGENPHFIHFKLSAARTLELAVNLRSLSTLVSPLRDYELTRAPENVPCLVSLYFQRAGQDDTSGNHWHLRITTGLTKPAQIQEVIRQEQGTLEFNERNFIIFQIFADRVESLKSRLRALPGTYCKFDQTPSGNVDGALRIAIYILEN